jgi:hypothetical protein
MKQIICTVYDRAAETYGRPMFVPSIGVAIRSFTDEINRNHGDNQLFNHPDDFDLYELGEYDDQTSRITTLDLPKVLILGKQAKLPQ